MTDRRRGELAVLVPHKTIGHAKTRLRCALVTEARQALSLQMLRHVLHVCTELRAADRLLLCGPQELQPLAGEYGATLIEGGSKGLRREVSMVSESPAVAGRAALLFVSSDLPLLQVDDLAEVVSAWEAGADLVLAPDRRERGTNAMLIDEPEVFAFAFGDVVGPGSFHTHRDHAIGHDLTVAAVRRPGLQLDIDLPVDVTDFIAEAPNNPLAQYCKARMEDEFRFE